MTAENPHDQPMRPFITLWTAQAISLLGSQLVQFAVVWWLTRTTGSATVLAMGTLAALLPQILISPFAGALVDRWPRKTVMIAADCIIAAATLGLAGLFWVDRASVAAIYALLLVRSAGSAFHWPAMQASTTLMVPQKFLPRIAGLNQSLFGAASIIIPPLGAVAVEQLAMQSVLLIDVATAIPAIAVLLLIAVPQPEKAAQPEQKPSMGADIREGLRFVLGWKGLMLLVLVGVLIHMLGRAAGSLLPLLILEHFKQGAVGLGLVESVAGAGAILGGAALGLWGGLRNKVATQMLAMILDGLLVIAIGLSQPDGFVLVTVLFFCQGFLEAIAVGIGGALGQILIPPEMQGRLFALSVSLTYIMAPLGLLVAGPTTDALGVPFWFVISGILFTLVGIGGLLIPAVLHVEDPKYRPLHLREAPQP